MGWSKDPGPPSSGEFPYYFYILLFKVENDTTLENIVNFQKVATCRHFLTTILLFIFSFVVKYFYNLLILLTVP